MRSPLQAPVCMREEFSHVPADLLSPLSESSSCVYTRDILSDRAVASRGITAVGATSLHLPRSEIALRVYTRYGFSDSRTAARVLSVKNLVPGVHARWVFWHMTRLPTVGKLSSVGKHVSRVHTGRRFLHRTALLGIRPFVLRDTTTTTGSRWAKNGTGDPPSGQAGPWIPFSGFFPAERPLRGFGTSAIVPLAANSRCVHFRLASAAAATRRHRVTPAGPPSSLQPWQSTPEVSAHIGKRQPSEPGGGFDWQKLPARVLTRAICCHGLRNDV